MKTATPVGPLATAARLKYAATLNEATGPLLDAIADAMSSMREDAPEGAEAWRWTPTVQAALALADLLIAGEIR